MTGMTGIYGGYISTEAFCVIFSVILLLRLKCGIGSDREIRILRTMFLWFIVLLITDMLWAMNADDFLLPPKLVNGAINAAADIAISWGCYYWYRFVAERSGRYGRIGKTAKILLALPAAVISVMLAASVFTGWMFFIDGNDHFQDTPLVYLRVGVNYFYLLLATVYAAWGGASLRLQTEAAGISWLCPVYSALHSDLSFRGYISSMAAGVAGHLSRAADSVSDHLCGPGNGDTEAAGGADAVPRGDHAQPDTAALSQ